jgi:putative flavoprotein involved in K+ transport
VTTSHDDDHRKQEVPIITGMMTAKRTDPLVIGGGQAGLATSYWLAKAGVDHLVVDRRDRLGGGWHDRWDRFCLVLPNFTVLLPGMPYDGDDPDGFMVREDVVKYLTRYASATNPTVRLGTTVTRLAATDEGLVAHADGTTFQARNVVLATGPYPRPRIPAAAYVVAHIVGRLAGQHQA